MSLELIVNNGPDVSKLTGIECEQALLAALIKENGLYEDIYKILKSQYFSFNVYGQLYQKLSRAMDAGEKVDVLTLKNHFEGNERLKELGGVDYLIQLSECFISFANCVSYAQHLKNLYLNRKVIQICHKQGSDIFTNPDFDALETIENIQQDLFKLKEEGILEDDDRSLESIGNRFLKMQKKL